MDVEPLGKFQEDWRPDEPRRLDPVYVERTSLRDALAAKRGLSPQNILGYVELIEPTFQVGVKGSPKMHGSVTNCIIVQQLFMDRLQECYSITLTEELADATLKYDVDPILLLQELLVLYRHAPEPEWLAPLRRRILGAREEEKTPRYRRRNQIFLRVFRDVPLPTWKIVFPDKLLQFRPLDGLRADLLSVAGKDLFSSSHLCSNVMSCGDCLNRERPLI